MFRFFRLPMPWLPWHLTSPLLCWGILRKVDHPNLQWKCRLDLGDDPEISGVPQESPMVIWELHLEREVHFKSNVGKLRWGCSVRGWLQLVMWLYKIMPVWSYVKSRNRHGFADFEWFRASCLNNSSGLLHGQVWSNGRRYAIGREVP